MSAIGLLSRSRIRRGWRSLAAVAVLGAVVGGLATAAIAGERRGASAADRLIAATRAPELTVSVNSADPADNDRVLAAIRAQPDAAAAWPARRFIGRTTLTKDWYYPLAGPPRPAELYRPMVDSGRLPDDAAVGELAITRQTSLNTGLGVGDAFDFDLYSPAQFDAVDVDSEIEPDGGHLRMQVVGILRDPSDIAAGRTQYTMLGSAALYEGYPGIGTVVLVKLAPGATVDGFLEHLRSVLPSTLIDVAPLGQAVAAAEPSLRVVSVGLWIMAAVIAATGVLPLSQLVRRRVGDHAHEDEVLRALGVDRRRRVAAGAIQVVPPALVGGVVCVVVAIGASPLFPVGRPRALDPHLGFDVNVAVVAIGALVTALTIVAVAFMASAAAVMTRRPRMRRSWTGVVARFGQVGPVPLALGFGLVLDREVGTGQRSVLRGVGTIAIGLAGLIGSLTWLDSLDRLADTPAEYGVDYDLIMEVPVDLNAQRTAELVADRRIEMVAQIANAPIEVGSRPTSATSVEFDKGALRPLVLEGRLPAGATEIAMGPALAEELALSVGSVVELDASGTPRAVEIVGLVLDVRSVAENYADGVFMTGDLLGDVALEPPYVQTAVRYAPPSDPVALRRVLDERYPWGVIDESDPAPPGAILNLVDVRIVPVILAWYFAAIVVASLVSTVLGASRRHRRTLAIARSLGMRPAQLYVTVWTMAVSILLIAATVGVVVGAGLGNAVWGSVARSVHVPTVVDRPVGLLSVMLCGLLVIGSIVAIRMTRTLLGGPASAALRVE